VTFGSAALLGSLVSRASFDRVTAHTLGCQEDLRNPPAPNLILRMDPPHSRDVKQVAEKIPSWIERLLLPRLSSLEGELKAFRGEVAGELKTVNGRIDGLDRRIDSVEKQMVSLRNEMNARFDALESKVTLVEDVTRLKIEMKALAEKVAAITTR